MKLEDKLFLNGFKPDETGGSHLTITSDEPCRKQCGALGRPCTTFCPAHVYMWEDDHITVSFNACLECGACRIGCPFKNIEWRYPRGEFGVTYKNG